MAVIMAAAAATVWIGLNRRYKAPSPMRCLPDQTAFVARLGDRSTLAEVTSGVMGDELTDMLGGNETRLLSARIDSLFGPDVISDPALSERDLYISFSLRDDGEPSQMAASFCLNNRMEWHKAMSALRDREGVTVSDTSFHGHGLFLLKQKGFSTPLYMAAGGGCLFAATEPELLMSFGKDSVTPMCDNLLFAQIERTISYSAPASVFINGGRMRAAGKKGNILACAFATMIRQEGAGSDWMAFDLGVSEEGLSADGFAVAQKPSLAMLTSKENTSALGLARRIPKGVSYFHRIGAGRRGISSPSFSDYLAQDTTGARYRASQSESYAQTGVDVEALLSQVFDAELALCTYGQKQDSTGARPGSFLIVDTRGGTKAHAVITQALTAMHGGASPMVIGEIQPGAGAVPDGVVARRADAEQVSAISVPVYGGFDKCDNTFFLKPLFGKDIPGRLFFRYGDAIVFANDMATLRRVLIDYVTGNTMEGDHKFESLMRHFGNDCSMFTYVTSPKGSGTARKGSGAAFDVACHQMTRTGNLPYISVFAHARNTDAEQSVDVIETAWRTRVDSVKNGKIWAVTNHYTKLTECLTQDADDKLCLIGADGMLLWRRPVDGNVVGEVSQIDYYGNGKLQYLLTTDRYLYIIDRLGNDVGPFPVRLPSTAESGASHAQYSDGSPMRIFVGCESGPVLFGPDGQRVEGWKASKPEGAMQDAPRHMVCAGKDYIVYHDKYAYYYADRRGNRRLGTPPLEPSTHGQMTISSNGCYFVTATSDGNIAAIDGDKGTLTTLRLDSVGGELAAMPISADRYLVIGTKNAYIADISGNEPKTVTHWRTGLESLSHVDNKNGLIIVLDGKAGMAHVYSSVDGGEISASPFKARGSVALGNGRDGIVAFTLGDAGEIIQVNLTKGRAE